MVLLTLCWTLAVPVASTQASSNDPTNDNDTDEHNNDTDEWNSVQDKAKSPWIDPDTPLDQRQIVSFPELPFSNDVRRTFDLVFSDEFNVDGRTFHDGQDPKWTALHSDDLTNNPLHWYSQDNVEYVRVLFQ